LTANALTAHEKPKSLTLDFAQKIATQANTYAKKKNWKLSIAIVNSEGNLLYFQRDPEAYSGSIDAAIQKAKSSNAFQRPTSAFVEAIKQGRTGLVTVKDVVALEGGLPIILNEKHVGAIGISGAKSIEDEEAARAALE
jgi:uncharacterized protein GlcG (DUF336 family)